MNAIEECRGESVAAVQQNRLQLQVQEVSRISRQDTPQSLQSNNVYSDDTIKLLKE